MAKQAAKKTTKRVVRKPKHVPIYYVRLITGEELVGFGDLKPRVMVLHDPCNIAAVEGMFILTPYGLAAKDRTFTFDRSHVVNCFEVDAQFEVLYVTSLKNVAHSKEYYDQVTHNSAALVNAAIERRNSIPEPTDEDLEKIEAEQKGPKVVVVDNLDTKEDGSRSKSKIIEELIKLAESKGKGKNADT